MSSFTYNLRLLLFHTRNTQIRHVYQTRKMSKESKRMERKRESFEEVVHYAGENVKRASRVYVWGSAMTGALGISSYLRLERSSHKVLKQMWRPARMRFLDQQGLKAKDVDCGCGFTVMLCKSDKSKKVQVYGTGINTDSQLGYNEYPLNSGRILDYIIQPVPISLPVMNPDITKPIAVACGRAHTLVLTDNEGVFSLGNNAYGQCGREIVEGEIYRGCSKVHQIKDLPNNIEQLVCGQDHNFFLTSDGQVYSCGLGADGQTGLGHFKATSQPTLVKGDIQGEKIIKISSQADCVLALSEKGDVFGWGNSEYNQFSTVTGETQLKIPRALDTQRCGKIKDIAAAGSKCAILNDKGQVFVWGYGILGKGPKLESCVKPSMIPETIFGQNEITPDSHVTQISAGINHFMAVTNHYSLYSWGKNVMGSLGISSNKDQYFPLQIAMPAEPRKVVCGLDHCVALCTSWC